MPAKHPWNAIPATRSSAPILKIRLYTILGVLGLAVLAGPLSFFLVSAKSAPVIPEPDIDYKTTGFAQLVAEDYLSARPTTLPVADGLEATFGAPSDPNNPVTALPYQGLSLYSTEGPKVDSGQTYDISTFVFRMGERPMLLDVTTLRTDDGPVLAAMPAMRPLDTSISGDADPLDYTKNEALKEMGSAAVGEAVAQWAAAYAAGDSKALYTLTRDPRPDRTYPGLGGFEVVGTPTIISAVGVDAASVPAIGGDVVKSPTYLRVRVLLQATGAQRYVSQQEFDLLVDEAGQPRVVAWGAPGAAPFDPFSNSNRH